MTATPAQFIWYELITTDLDAALTFYRGVIGWSVQDSGLTDRRYAILNAGERGVGGAMPVPPQAVEGGGRPGWVGYIDVDDVDAFVDRVKAQGGAVHRAAEDIPGVGRFAMVADPQGAVFIMMKPIPPAGGVPPRPAPGTPGHAGWHELHAGDGKSAFDFYSGLFGWTKADAMDMGPMGVYQLFAAGAEPIGGMMTKMAEIPHPHWLYYFNVDDIEAAAGRVKSHGGQVVNGPHQVPGGNWIVQASDPQGAMFALVAPAS
jgi:hypothetical protein